MADYYTTGVLGVRHGGELTPQDIISLHDFVTSFQRVYARLAVKENDDEDDKRRETIRATVEKEQPQLLSLVHRLSWELGALSKVEMQNEALVVVWDESFGGFNVSNLIAGWLRANNKVKTCIQVSEANTCSRKLCGAFSGEIYMVTARGVRTASTRMYKDTYPPHFNTMFE